MNYHQNFIIIAKVDFAKQNIYVRPQKVLVNGCREKS